MTESTSTNPSDEHLDSDYDGAWKEALRFHLREFIEKCFPQLSELVDWKFEPEWLDKEISQFIGQAGQRNREVDLLFKVRLIGGQDQWIFCHLEIQSSFEPNFSFRIDLYNSGLKWIFKREVLTLVILADIKRDWRPSEHHFSLGGFGYDLRFPICKLLDRLEVDWAEDTSLTADVARAQIAGLRTAGDPESRFYEKTKLVRNLYKAGYTADDIRERFRLIDWMMHLPMNLSRRFDADLVLFEKELKMPYVTSFERNAEERGLERGLEKGLEKGREEGSITIVLEQLTECLGMVPVEFEKRVRGLSFEQTRTLARSLFKFQSIADLENWLNRTMSEVSK